MQFTTRRRILAVSLIAPLLAGLVACGDAATRPQPASSAMLSPEAAHRLLTLNTSCNVGRIYTLVTALAPVPPGEHEFHLAGVVTSTLTLAGWQIKAAQQAVIAITTALATPAVQLQLAGTPTEKAAESAELTNLLFSCVGLPSVNTPPSAFGPGGTITTIGTTGGVAVTRDSSAAISLPAGALTGNHLLTIAPRAVGVNAPCLSTVTGVSQIGGCVDITLTPADSLNRAAGTVVVALCNTVVDLDARHSSLRISQQHEDRAPVILDYVPPTTVPPLHCGPSQIGAIGVPLGERIFGRTWARIAHVLDVAVRPFTATPAYALDGLGGGLCATSDACFLSSFSVVAPSLVVSPATATVTAGSNAQFAALPPAGIRDVSALSPLVWSAGLPGGTLTDGGSEGFGLITAAGAYTAPTQVPAGGAVQLCARLAPFAGPGTSPSRAPMPGCAQVRITTPPDGPGIVKSLSLVASPTTLASCTGGLFTFTGTITSNASGTVAYTWDRSDGAHDTIAHSVFFEVPGTMTVITTWSLGQQPSPFNGWQRLRTLAPNASVSNQANFTLTCNP